MSVQLIENKLTNERGYQARWKGKSKYFSCRKMGDHIAKAKAIMAEKAMLDAVPYTGGAMRRGCNTHRSRIRTTAGPNGLIFLWKQSSSGTYFPVIRGHYRRHDGMATNTEISIHRHGVYGACLRIHQCKVDHGYPCMPSGELADIVLQWLVDTARQHPNNLSIYDVPDIDPYGNLYVDNLETKTIMVVGNTIPSVNVLKQGETFYSIRWITAVGDNLKRALDAITHDVDTSTRAQRLRAADMLLLVALNKEVDAYFVPVGKPMAAIVQKVFKENELSLVHCGKTVEHGYTMLYK